LKYEIKGQGQKLIFRAKVTISYNQKWKGKFEKIQKRKISIGFWDIFKMSTTAPPDVSGVYKKVEIWIKRNNSRIDSNKIQNWPIYPTVIFSQSTSRPCDPWQSLRWRPIRESRKGWETINYGSIICCRFQLKSKHFI